MKRSKFSLSHYRLLSCDMGYIIPLTWYEANPGDTIQQSTNMLIRCSPLLSAVMHPVRIRVHHWFVPNRIIWDGWELFITGGEDGESTITVPHRTLDGVVEKGSLYDYMGVTPGDYTGSPLDISMLPFRAYNLIFNEHYRDQDLVEKRGISTGNGEDLITAVATIAQAAWEKDYFTTCRPWEQKGEDVTLPIAGTAPVVGDGTPIFETDGDSNALLAGEGDVRTGIALDGPMAWDDPNLLTDLSAATSISVNDLREALAIQRYKEARAQYGSRYVEYLRSIGVRSSDARLQNPEYLGGGRSVIQFSEVLQTGPDAQGGEDSFVGDMKGHGISAMRTNRYRRYFEEHGIVMTVLSVVPKAMYMQSMHKQWFRTTKEEYFQHQLQYLGDQEVYNKEVKGNHSDPNGVFGYQQRYDDYRFIPSMIAGEMRDELDYWHYGRDMESVDPALNASFVTATPTKRVNADFNADCLYVMANHSIQARRMMAYNPRPRTF